MKQVAKKKQPAARPGPKAAASSVRRQPPATVSRRRRLWAFAAVLLLACLLRLIFLDLKPLHHDEGVNGMFMTNLFRAGLYHYDPENYHGPSLYYFGLITTTVNALFYGKEGLSTFAIRLVPAIFGTALIYLVILLRSYLGTLAVLVAAALLAVSPGMVFFSRYFIHEIPFVCLTLTLVITALRYRETARPRYLMLASASAALMFATKETCIISFAVLALSWICMRVYLRLRKRPDGLPSPANTGLAVQGGTTGVRLRLAALAALVFVVIGVLFFSSFFTNFPRGVLDSLRTFQVWTNRSVQTDQYRAPWFTYLQWLSKIELPILVLGAIGILIALWKARNGFAVFTAFWALGITAAYSLLPYKTPWLALNFILPLGIMAGYGLGEWYGSPALDGIDASPRSPLRIPSMLVFIAALCFSGYQAIDLNFFRYDDDSIPYVYAHTNRQLLDLVAEVDSIAARNPAGKDIGITIVADVYWPLPWYLRDYLRAGFWGKIIQSTEPILISSGSQTEEVERQLGRYYAVYKAYELRPGNVLVLFLRRDVRP